jgi:hypothetical protein
VTISGSANAGAGAGASVGVQGTTYTINGVNHNLVDIGAITIGERGWRTG